MTWDEEAAKAIEQKKRQAEHDEKVNKWKKELKRAQGPLIRPGFFLALSGVLMMLFGYLVFNVSYAGDVVNLDLLQQRQNTIIIGCTLFIVGALYRKPIA